MKKKKEKARINAMIEAIMQVAQGNFSTQVELSGKNDHLDSLAMGLNMMIDDLRSSKAFEIQNEKFRMINSELEKAIEKAQESERLKSAFLANMSHEIRTPLNSILGFSSLLSQDIEPTKFNNYSKIIQNSGQQLLRIIDDILDLSKLESGQLPIVTELVDINNILQEVYSIQNKNKKLQSSPKITLKRPRIDPNNIIFLKTDSIRLAQVLNNLINNAIKFTNEGFIESGYTIKPEKDEKVVEFYVKDTGMGIPKEKQESIFDRFVQVENIRVTGGNGLGLSICKGLIELLGGKIWVESEVGIGSCFYFTLPLSFEKLPDTPSYREPGENQITLNGQTVYIAEDNAEASYYLEEILRPEGMIVKNASDGQALINLVQEQTPDLILLDINMPVKNGYETISEIRQKGLTVPVIAQTAFAMPEEKSTILNAGCNDYIAKPFKREELLSTIRKVLRNDSK